MQLQVSSTIRKPLRTTFERHVEQSMISLRQSQTNAAELAALCHPCWPCWPCWLRLQLLPDLRSREVFRAGDTSTSASCYARSCAGQHSTRRSAKGDLKKPLTSTNSETAGKARPEPLATTALAIQKQGQKRRACTPLLHWKADAPLDVGSASSERQQSGHFSLRSPGLHSSQRRIVTIEQSLGVSRRGSLTFTPPLRLEIVEPCRASWPWPFGFKKSDR